MTIAIVILSIGTVALVNLSRSRRRILADEWLSDRPCPSHSGPGPEPLGGRVGALITPLRRSQPCLRGKRRAVWSQSGEADIQKMGECRE